MHIILTFLHALKDPFTWNPRSNLYFWFGILWGLPVPVFSLFLDATLGHPSGQSVLWMLAHHPVHWFALLHPAIFGVVFGALGAIHRNQEAQRDSLIAQLRETSRTDPLTGICNRRCILAELEATLHRADRADDPVSVVLFDLDNFKSVNDSQGHLAGDKILKETAQALRSVLRRGEALGRYGGDEFLAVLPGPAAAATSLAERACSAVRDRTGLTMCAGIAVRPDDGTSPHMLIANADRALARLKDTRHRANPETRRITLR